MLRSLHCTGLFDKTINLERLDLKNNKIATIASNQFLQLKKLKVVDLTYNVCINNNFTSGIDGIIVRRFYTYQRVQNNENEEGYESSKNDLKSLFSAILTCTVVILIKLSIKND